MNAFIEFCHFFKNKSIMTQKKWGWFPIRKKFCSAALSLFARITCKTLDLLIVTLAHTVIPNDWCTLDPCYIKKTAKMRENSQKSCVSKPYQTEIWEALPGLGGGSRSPPIHLRYRATKTSKIMLPWQMDSFLTYMRFYLSFFFDGSQKNAKIENQASR